MRKSVSLSLIMASDAPTRPAPSESGESVPLPKAAALSDPGQWVDDHGDYLFSYAMSRLRDLAKSQDVVQETFLAALKKRSAFAGKSAERGWLLGILKHKIHDVFRKSGRETSFTDLGFFATEEEQQFVADGLQKGAWNHGLGPADWPAEAGEGLDREEFWQTFRNCASKLPQNVSRVFLMRELDGVDSRTICADLNITENNLWVMLHRARMALRRCLELNWFDPMQPAPTTGKSRPRT